MSFLKRLCFSTRYFKAAKETGFEGFEIYGASGYHPSQLSGEFLPLGPRVRKIFSSFLILNNNQKQKILKERSLMVALIKKGYTDYPKLKD
jgi:hypothetical protein